MTGEEVEKRFRVGIAGNGITCYTYSMKKTQIIEVETKAGNIFRGKLISDDSFGIKLDCNGIRREIPNMRIENVHYF